MLATALADDAFGGDLARSHLVGEALLAPEIIDLEVLSVLRRQVVGRHLPSRRAQLAIDDLRVLPIRRITHYPFIDRCWELRNNLTPYDAAYIAIAEVFDIPLLTADRRLANSPGIRCKVDVLTAD